VSPLILDGTKNQGADAPARPFGSGETPMSFDPFAAGSDLPPDYGPAAPSPADRTYYARQRVQAPAIALIVVGILNLLMTLLQVGMTAWIMVTPAQQIQKMMEERLDILEKGGVLPPDIRKKLGEGWKDPGTAKSQTVIQYTISSLLMVLLTVLTLIGGVRMRSLRSYGLSVAGAISAAIPCITCGGTCCFGEIIGIWALVVLLNPDVKTAFR
ncbi:MAG: hypothetical protein ACRELG_19290, partial [Gemmataceae bacterium]